MKDATITSSRMQLLRLKKKNKKQLRNLPLYTAVLLCPIEKNVEMISHNGHISELHSCNRITSCGQKYSLQIHLKISENNCKILITMHYSSKSIITHPY